MDTLSRYSDTSLYGSRRYVASCIPFSDAFARPNGPLGNGWTMRAGLGGTTLAIVADIVTAIGGAGPSYDADAIRPLKDTPSYVEINEASHPNSPAAGANSFVYAGTDATPGLRSGVVFTQGSGNGAGSGNYVLTNFITGVGTVKSTVIGPIGAQRMRLRRSNTAGIWTYIGSIGGVDIIQWVDNAAEALWGTVVGFLLGATSPSNGLGVANVPSVNGFVTDGCA